MRVKRDGMEYEIKPITIKVSASLSESCNFTTSTETTQIVVIIEMRKFKNVYLLLNLIFKS